MSRPHRIKCWPIFYHNIENDSRPFEIRKNDRNYQVEDILLIQEYSPETAAYTGRQCWRRITYVTSYEQKDGMVVMGLANDGEDKVVTHEFV